MSKHEVKQCARCSSTFECKAGSITNCQCYGIELTVSAEVYIAKTYTDCLCRTCLLQLNNQYMLFTAQPERYKQR